MPRHLFKLERISLGPVIGIGTAKAARKGKAAILISRRPLPVTKHTITGVTKDETGAAVGGFTVYLFAMINGIPIFRDTTISDGSGNYSFNVNPSDRYWVVDYKSGSPDKAGATLQTLTGVAM